MTDEPLKFLSRPAGNLDNIRLEDHVDMLTGRMITRDGIKGMMFKEAAVWAADWWQRKARSMMPDYIPRKGGDYLEEFGTKSGILLGLPWEQLNKEERVRIIILWWEKVGIKTHGLGLGTSQDGGNA